MFLHVDSFSDSTAAQAEMSLCWEYMSEGIFSHILQLQYVMEDISDTLV